MPPSNSFLEKLILPAGDLITGGSFIKELRRIRRYFDLEEPAILEIRKQKLRNLLKHATQKSAYYSRYADRLTDDPYEALSRMPVLEKSILRNQFRELLTRDLNGLIRINNSGSSGVQTTVYQSRSDQSIVRAVQTAFWERAGFVIGGPVVQTGINFPRSFEKRVKDKLFNTCYISAFALNETDVRTVLQFAERNKNDEIVLIGYASSLYVLAQMVSNMAGKLRFRSVISLGDKLFDHYRKKIEQEFDTKVYETYGASEGLMMGFQSDLDYMYVPDFHVIMEIVDDHGQPVRDGEMGHVLVTSLDNMAMPLIRYRVGDLAVRLPREEYPAQRNLPFSLLQKVIGRDTDIVRTPGGTQLVVHTFTGIFEHWPQIRQFCVIQNNLNGMTIQYIPSEGFSPDVLQKIETILRSHITEPFEISFEEVGAIAPTGSGKPQIIVSKLGKSPKDA